MDSEPQRTQRTQRDELLSQALWTDEEMVPDPGWNQITNQVIGAALEVHKSLGPGYQEQMYANALAIAMTRRGLRFEREKEFSVYFEGQVVGCGRVDFLVEGAIVVELKAADGLTPLFTAQLISYLKALKSPLGLLINFNVRRLVEGIKRVAGHPEWH